jgi:hypothetical protein
MTKRFLFLTAMLAFLLSNSAFAEGSDSSRSATPASSKIVVSKSRSNDRKVAYNERRKDKDDWACGHSHDDGDHSRHKDKDRCPSSGH